MFSLLNFLKIAIVGYGLILVFMAIFQDHFIFFPQPISNPGVAQFAQHEISFQREGIILKGWFIRKKISAENPLIIYYGGNAEEVSNHLFESHHFSANAFLFLNYRGFGKSEGKPSQTDLVSDALFVLAEVLKQENIKPDQVILMGRSLGSGVAVQVAASSKVKGLILVTPFDSLLNVAKTHYPFLPVGLLLRHPFNSAALAPEIDMPVLMMMGTGDNIISNQRTRALARVWGGPVELVTIEGAGHNDIQAFSRYWYEMRRFITSLSDL